MPIYDYCCARCGAFDQMRGVARRDEPAPCPHCAEPAPRVRSGVPLLLTHGERGGAGAGANANTTDESAYLARHRTGCFCCG